MHENLVIDICDHVGVGSAPAGEPCIEILGSDLEDRHASVADPEIERHRVKKKSGDRATASIALVGLMALFIGWPKSVSSAGAVQSRDTSASGRQWGASSEIAICHPAERGAGTKRH